MSKTPVDQNLYRQLTKSEESAWLALSELKDGDWEKICSRTSFNGQELTPIGVVVNEWHRSWTRLWRRLPDLQPPVNEPIGVKKDKPIYLAHALWTVHYEQGFLRDAFTTIYSGLVTGGMDVNVVDADGHKPIATACVLAPHARGLIEAIMTGYKLQVEQDNVISVNGKGMSLYALVQRQLESRGVSAKNFWSSLVPEAKTWLETSALANDEPLSQAIDGLRVINQQNSKVKKVSLRV